MIIVDVIVWPLSSIVDKLTGISYLLFITLIEYYLNLADFILAIASYYSKSLYIRLVLKT